MAGLSQEQQNIKNIGVSEAQLQGVDLNIVLATLEAETSFRNILGDSGNALGPGQVWSKWHNADFIYIANRMRLNWPTTLEDRQKFVLSNNQFATAVAVRVIGKIWNSARKDFRRFSLAYVGPKIPDSDYNRRYNIWLKYQGTGSLEVNASPGAGDVSLTLGNTLNAGNQEINSIDFPPTNFGVVAGSERTGNVLYGRRYRVLVSSPSGVALDVSQLRCTFRIKKTINQSPNFSEIVIYNLNAATENAIIQEGNRVIIEAGYEGNQYGLLFDGDVVQTIRDKEDSVTYRLTLYALDGDRGYNQGFINFSLTKGQSQREVVESVVKNSTVSTQLNSISDDLSKQKLTRGKVMFGMMKDYLRQLSQTSEASFYLEDGKVNIVKMSDLPEGEVISLTPDSGLIGTPQQADLGITFRCLLNPSIKISGMVHLDSSLIRAQVFQLGQVQRSLDGDGLYRVISVDHIGDTRGDDFFTEATTVSQAGGIPNLMTSPGANPF
ncbi:hypothetical protein SAMN04487969_102494 [Paenibacillus algorifonticola]|uniref:Uncharacterized protein n=1 Tax=Paenibacillus algorifonticola TaxID=684063 RepID=A0A1I2AHF9_9BACL|nr:hypothetical protein [Paenibacillus algorifonticola]SFE43312.1 hypothetical protein SAMN04487969_102494 [Paenibacillus algorifonticola]